MGRRRNAKARTTVQQATDATTPQSAEPRSLGPMGSLPVVGDLNQRHVFGKYRLIDNTPVVGTITFTASTVLDDEGSDLILMPRIFVAPLDLNGDFDIQLPVTDDPDITPVDWTYTVTETFTNAEGRKPYQIEVPYDGGNDAPISIRDLIVPSPTGPPAPAYQRSDPDLTAIAAMDSGTAGMIASDGAGWVKKTYAQVKVSLGLVKADVGLGNVDNTADADKPISTATAAALAVKADLVGGVIPSAQLPAISTGQTVSVASQAAMLALTAAQVQPGDVAIRTDQGRRWLLAGADPSVLANWIQLETPDAVTSVNGQTGPVVLGKADVGLGNVDNTSDVNKPVSTAQAAADALRVLKAGDTMTGSLTVNGSAAGSALTARVDAAVNGRGPEVAFLDIKAGQATPNKFIRVVGGVMQWLNSAYTTALMTLADDGTLSTTGGIWDPSGRVYSPGNPPAKTIRISQTFTLAGAVSATTTPLAYIPVPAGQTVRLVTVKTILGAGTATVAVQKAGVALSGLGAIAVTNAAATTNATGTGNDNVFADGQSWRIVVSAPAGGATDLTVSAYFDITV